MVSEVFAGIGAFKQIVDAVKSLKEMADSKARADAIGEIQAKLNAAQTAYFAVEGRCREVEAQLRKLKAWNREKTRYELHRLEPGVLLYRIKETHRRGEPMHELCADCYNRGVKGLLHVISSADGVMVYECGECKTRHSTGKRTKNSSRTRGDKRSWMSG